MSIEEQIVHYKNLVRQITELEQQRKELGMAILAQMPDKIFSTGNYVVRRYDRLSFKVPLEKARAFGATKMEEVLDKEKLKQLHQLGEIIPGISSFKFIQVSEKGSHQTDHLPGDEAS